MSATSVLSKSTQKSKKYPYNPVFFILSTEKSFETLPKHNGAAFISESVISNLYTFTQLTNKLGEPL